MEEPLSQQSIIESATVQLELLKLTSEILKPTAQEKQQTVAVLFEQFDRSFEQGLITLETKEYLVNMWLDGYLSADSSDVTSNT